MFQTSRTVESLPERGQVHVVPTDSEEDGEGGKEEPKDHSSRTADFSCILGSQSLKINHKTPPPTNRFFGRVARSPYWEQPTHSSVWSHHWTYDWNRVLWSDETKILHFGHVHCRHVCHQKRDAYKEKHIIPTIKYDGGPLMLWGCFNASGPGALVKINGKINSTKYQDILASDRKQRLDRRWTFQQDNDPKHTSKLIQKWFQENKINVLQWPFCALDLNPIENMWS